MRAGVRDAVHNWFLLAVLALAAFGGALVQMRWGGDALAAPLYLVLVTLAAAGACFAWFARYPPATLAPPGVYLALAVALVLSAYFAGRVPAGREVGVWTCVGVAVAVHGLLERHPVVVVVGVLAAATGVVGAVLEVPSLPVVLQLACAGLFALGAVVVRAVGAQLASAGESSSEDDATLDRGEGPDLP